MLHYPEKVARKSIQKSKYRDLSSFCTGPCHTKVESIQCTYFMYTFCGHKAIWGMSRQQSGRTKKNQLQTRGEQRIRILPHVWIIAVITIITHHKDRVLRNTLHHKHTVNKSWFGMYFYASKLVQMELKFYAYGRRFEVGMRNIYW